SDDQAVYRAADRRAARLSRMAGVEFAGNGSLRRQWPGGGRDLEGGRRRLRDRYLPDELPRDRPDGRDGVACEDRGGCEGGRGGEAAGPLHSDEKERAGRGVL